MVDNGGFVLNGVPATTYGVTLLYGPGQPITPETRDRTEEIPGKSGQYWFDSDLGVRTFSLPCQFQGTKADAAALDVLVKAFSRVFVDVNGKPRLISLVFDDAPTITYLVRLSGGIQINREWVHPTDFTLTLVADDPYGYEAEDITTATITTSGGNMAVTSSGNISTPAKVCVKNNGTVPLTGFTITIEYPLEV
jgi:phage-related protein